MSRWLRTAAAAALLAAPVTVVGAAPAFAEADVRGRHDAVRQRVVLRDQQPGIPQTWGLATGKGVTVAVVDSGVDPGNAHLRGAVVPGTSFVPGPPTRTSSATAPGSPASSPRGTSRGPR